MTAREDLKRLSDHLRRGHRKLAVQLSGDHFPYGIRYNEDGSESLFGRGYSALWTRQADGRIVGGGPYGGREEFLFDDDRPSYQQYEINVAVEGHSEEVACLKSEPPQTGLAARVHFIINMHMEVQK